MPRYNGNTKLYSGRNGKLLFVKEIKETASKKQETFGLFLCFGSIQRSNNIMWTRHSAQLLTPILVKDGYNRAR